MELVRHGIKLIPLSSEKLELLREWRNSDFIKSCMFFKDEITENEQIKWFKSLGENKHYFIINDGQEDFGCCNINLSKDDNDEWFAEGGIFISSFDRLNDVAPIKAMFIIYDWAFMYKSAEYISARIRIDNKRAVRFNLGLGFIKDTCNEEEVRMLLSRADFYKKYEKYKKILG